jgi:alcohol dehydrogenase class IV
MTKGGDKTMQFEFTTSMRIIFGEGRSKEIGSFAAQYGKRVMLVTGGMPSRYAQLFSSIEDAGMEEVSFQVTREPTIDVVREGSQRGRAFGCDVVIAVGGGSVIDAGKAIAAFLANEGDPLDFLEVIGHGQALRNRSLPFIALPTTAGTGSEVTRNAVLASPEHRVKVSLRSPYMLPSMAVIDPELTYTLPPEVTATTGMDALTQVLEPFVSIQANPFTDILCREGLRRGSKSLMHAFVNGEDHEARRDMAFTSLLGGMALANSKLGAVHGFAGPLGGMYPVPHGAVCARLLPYVMDVNIRALEERAPNAKTLQRYHEVGRIVTANGSASARDGIAWAKGMCEKLAIEPLGMYGLREEDIPDVIQRASVSSSMKGNPIELTIAEMTEILERAL